jgi:hypothetical protein
VGGADAGAAAALSSNCQQEQQEFEKRAVFLTWAHIGRLKLGLSLKTAVQQGVRKQERRGKEEALGVGKAIYARSVHYNFE